MCSGLSFVSAWAHGVSAIVIECAFWGSAITALVYWSWYPLVIFPLTLFLWSLVIGTLFPLKPTERKAVVSARWAALWQTALLIAVVFFVAIFTRG